MKCTGCGKNHPRTPEFFYRKKASKDGLSRQCKVCHNTKIRANPKFEGQRRRSWLKNKYNLTLEEYSSLLEKQGGKCAICNITPDYNLCVDHNHQSGKVRGLLCRSCNKAIGQLGDTKEALLKAYLYLSQKDS